MTDSKRSGRMWFACHEPTGLIPETSPYDDRCTQLAYHFFNMLDECWFSIQLRVEVFDGWTLFAV